MAVAIQPLFLSLTLSIFAIPGFKILQETVGHGIKPSDGADFAFLPCAAQYVPFEKRADRAYDATKYRGPDVSVFDYPCRIAIELIEYFMERIKSIVLNIARNDRRVNIAFSGIIYRSIIEPDLCSIEQSNGVVR